MAKRGNFAVPVGWSGQDRRFGEVIKENLDVLTGTRGDPLDRAITARDLIDSGIATLPRGANFYSGASNGLAPANDSFEQLDIPPAPTNLQASGAFENILLTWDLKQYKGHAFTQIYRHTSDDIANATLLGQVSGYTGVYADQVGESSTYYYWVKAVNNNGEEGPFNSSAGTLGQTAPDVTFLLNKLTNAITSSELATELSTPIANLPSNTSFSIANLQSQIDTFYTVDAWASGTSYAVNDLVTFSGNLYEALQAHTSSSSNQPTGSTSSNSYWTYVGAYTSLASAVAGNTSDISDINYISATSSSAAAQKIASLDSTVNNSTTGVAATATAVSGLTTRVTNTENATTTNSNDIASLENTVNDSNTGVAATATAVSGLTTRVTNTENATTNNTADITANTSDITALENTVNNPSTGVSATATALSSLTTRVTSTENATTANSTDITALENTVNDSSTGVAATASAVSNLQTTVSTQGGNISSNSSNITALQNTVNDSSTGVAATASALSGLTTTVNNQGGQLSAAVSDISTLNTTVGNHTTSISTNSSSINGLEGKYTVKIDNNGAVAGYGLASTANSAGNITSEFIVNADRFAIMRGGSNTAAATVPFVVQATSTTLNGETVPAGVYMADAFIKNGSITSAKIGSLNADKITAGEIDVANRIGTNAIEASKLLLDGTSLKEVTLSDGRKALGVDAISANAIESGTLDASNVTIDNLYANNITGDINLLSPFKLASAVSIGSGDTQIFAGTFDAVPTDSNGVLLDKPKKPYVTAVGFGNWENNVVYKIKLQMKPNVGTTTTTVGSITSVGSYYIWGLQYFWIKVSGDKQNVLPANGTLKIGSNSYGTVLWTVYDLNSDTTQITYNVLNGGFTSSHVNSTLSISIAPAWQTVSEIMFRANHDYHPEPFAISGGLSTAYSVSVDFKIMADTYGTNQYNLPTAGHGTDWTHDKVFALEGLKMSLR